MKILALVTEAYGGKGGIAQANRDLIEALAAKHLVTILPRKGGSGTPVSGVEQLRGVNQKYLYAAKAVCVATHKKFDWIFCGHLHMVGLADTLSRITGAPYWLHLHGIEAWKKPCASLRIATERAARVTAVSRYTRRIFLSWANIDPHRVRVLPNTVGDRFFPGPKPEGLAKKYGLQGKNVILTVGRLSSAEKYKGQDRVISILPDIVREFSNAIYVIVGDGDDASRLKALACKKGVEKHVLFLGEAPDRDLPDLYRMADVFVMPSTGEGFGIAFLEAAFSGIPVIGGNRDGSLDPLCDGEGGRAVNPEDPLELVSAVQAALRGNQTGARSHRFHRSRFTAHAQRLAADFYDKLDM